MPQGRGVEVVRDEIAEQVGTPVYVVDEDDLRTRARDFATAFAGWDVYYAGKSFLCTAVARWVAEELGPDVPLHFSGFHPDYKMRDIGSTPPETLTRARRIAIAEGIRFVYTGNVHDRAGDTNWCPA